MNDKNKCFSTDCFILTRFSLLFLTSLLWPTLISVDISVVLSGREGPYRVEILQYCQRKKLSNDKRINDSLEQEILVSDSL